VGFRRCQDIVAWQLARELERRIFAFTANWPSAGDFDYCCQIRNSGASAPRNICEGFGRFLPADFARFVRIAHGSLEETKDHLDAGLERKYLSEEEHREMCSLAHRALGASTRLIVYLDRAAEEWKKEGRRRPKPKAQPDPEP
jgi:four helix bundle protein